MIIRILFIASTVMPFLSSGQNVIKVPLERRLIKPHTHFKKYLGHEGRRKLAPTAVPVTNY